MASKSNTTIGLDIDTHCIRAAKVTARRLGKSVQYVVDRVDELNGAFVKDESIVEGLRKMHNIVSPSVNDRVVTCLAGKQVYAAQVQHRKLPESEMKNALRFEIRKNLPFESGGSTIEYQYLEGAKTVSEPQIMVTAVSNILLDRHLRLFQKAGFKPDIVDILPLAVANSFWATNFASKPADVNFVAHIGPEMTTVIIDGDGAPFYHRTIYFTASELFGANKDAAMSERERDRRIGGLAEELTRSMTYYESNFRTANLSEMFLMGPYCDTALIPELTKRTGLKAKSMDLLKSLDPKRDTTPGLFDLVLSLAMRTDKPLTRAG